MATATVTGKVLNPDRSANAGAVVRAYLYPPSHPVYGPDLAEIVHVAQTTTANDGTWSLALERTDTMTPSGMVYAVLISPANTTGALLAAPQITQYITVPAGGGALEALLTDPPPSPVAAENPLVASLTATGSVTGAVRDTGGEVYNVKAFGAAGDGVTDDTAAIQAAVAAAAVGGGVVYFAAGTYNVGSPILGASGVSFRGAGRQATVLRAAASFPVPANVGSGQGTGLIQYAGTFGSSSPSQPIFQYVAVSDLTLDMSLVDDTHLNCMCGIFQDYSQLRHARFERLHYLGRTRGQGILLQGLGRITGGWSSDIIIRDISAVNGAGTVSVYLNAVNDATATYSGVTIENIYNFVGSVSGIVDDRVAVVGAQGGGSQSAPARVSNVSVRNVFIEMDPAQTTTGLVNGVKLDTGTWTMLENISVRDIFFLGDSSAAAQAPVIVLLEANSYIQNYSVDGVYGYKCAGLKLVLTRHDAVPTLHVRNVELEQCTDVMGAVKLAVTSAPSGDELIIIDGLSAHMTTSTAAAVMLESGTTGQGASGLISVSRVVAAGCHYGLTTDKVDDGSTRQAAYSNIRISDSDFSSCTTPISGSAPYRASNVKGLTDAGVLSALDAGEETLPRLLVRSNTVSLASGTLLLGYFTAQKSETVTAVTTGTGSSAASGTTLARYGIYSVDAAGNLSLVASTPSDTALWGSASQSTTGSNVQKSLSASLRTVPGQRYAVGLLFVGTTGPQVLGTTPAAGDAGTSAVSPRLCAQISGQSDLPSSISAGSLSNTGSMPYAQLLP